MVFENSVAEIIVNKNSLQYLMLNMYKNKTPSRVVARQIKHSSVTVLRQKKNIHLERKNLKIWIKISVKNTVLCLVTYDSTKADKDYTAVK